MENLAPFVGQIYFGEEGEGSLGSPLVIRAGNYESSSSHSTYTTTSTQRVRTCISSKNIGKMAQYVHHHLVLHSLQLRECVYASLGQEHWQNHLRMSENKQQPSIDKQILFDADQYLRL